jgi:hypothetical protein
MEIVLSDEAIQTVMAFTKKMAEIGSLCGTENTFNCS